MRMLDFAWRLQARRFIFAALAAFVTTACLAGGQNQAQQEQIKQHEQKLAEARAAKNQNEEAQQLLDLGLLYSTAGKIQKALECDTQALTTAREVKSRSIEAAALDDSSTVYSYLGQKQKALEYLNQALPIQQELSDRKGEDTTLTRIGQVYDGLGQLQKAMDYLNRALPIARGAGDRKGEAETLENIGGVYGDQGDLQKALEYFVQALPIRREVGDRMGEAKSLNDLGEVYMYMGQAPKGLEYTNQALTIQREVGYRDGEALSLNDIGFAYDNMGQKQKALEYDDQALAILREVGDRGQEATTLNNIGLIYSDLGQKQKALEYYNQALPILREMGNRTVEAVTLSNIGMIDSDLGQNQNALQYYNQALPIFREIGDRRGAATTLNNMANVYANLGEMQKTLEYFGQVLPILHEVGDRRDEAATLNNIGEVYSDLGQRQQALEYFNQALPMLRETGNRSVESTTLNNIGQLYSALGQKAKALEYLNQALPIFRALGDRSGEAMALSNIGGVYSDLGEKQKALEFMNQALPIRREVGDRQGEAYTLENLGRVYDGLGQKQEALPRELAALSLATALGDPDLQGAVDDSLMRHFRDQKLRDPAILFGMDAVNGYQRMRKNISGLGKDVQASFAQSKSSTYRQLAELLVQADRLGEAEQVLDLLKEQELKEVVRGAAPDAAAKLEPLKLTAVQEKAQNELAAPEKTAAAVTDLSMEYAALLAKPARTPGEDARLKTLDASIEAGNGEVSEFFKKTLYPELAQKAGTQDANALLSKEKSEVSRLQNTLAELGSGVMGIRLLLGDDHAYAIVVTAQARRKYELKATPAELRSKVLQVRDDLRSPASDPKPHLAELYAMVVAPLDDELKALALTIPAQNRMPTLLWSLDGVLRYIPMAALYDGRHYMLERFNNVLFTPESYGHMTASSGKATVKLSVLAMGLSKSYGGLPALPGVLPELDAVVHDPAVPDSHGPIEGKLLPNEQFTLAALKAELGTGKSFPVVHIASHFVEETGSGDEPYLMLGGEASGAAEGYALTLSKMQDSTISFHGTELLTLSACSTAKGDAGRDGQEMDSLGMIAQQKDAEAVLATLWDVNDASTSRLMGDFYARWVRRPAEGKAEALRQAQLALLHQPSSETAAGGDRGFKNARKETAVPPEAGYSHPYYWAPFVLIGNYE